MNRGAWQAIVHGVSRAGHDLATKHTHTHTFLCLITTLGKFLRSRIISTAL